MADNLSAFTGCLLGLAVGDAMGVTVDTKKYDEICQMYGPAGLLGYDLVNGFAQISSYTQLAAYSCNGLIMGLARGQTTPIQHITLALKEWAQVQNLPREPQRRLCWLSHMSQMRVRRSMDPRTLDALTRDMLGTPQSPANQGQGPGTLTAAVPVGLFFSPERMEFSQIGELGAQTVALTHGDPMTFLCGAVIAYAIAGIVQAPQTPLKEQLLCAAQAVQAQFGTQFPQAQQLQNAIDHAAALADDPQNIHPQVMEMLSCNTASEVLCGAVYAALASRGDFDSALIIAVNHSGKSAAVGALTGAYVGAQLGQEALPEFYLECLEPTQLLRQLAHDLHNTSPGQWRRRLFDDDWDRKYIQGQPVDFAPQ